MLLRTLLAAICCVALLVLMRRSMTAGATAVLVYLAFMGGVRRWLIPVAGYAGNDPLLLCVPLVTLIVGLPIVVRDSHRPRTKLQRRMLWIFGLISVQTVNPLQGGLGVGVAGFLFFGIPVLWYFIGRDFASVYTLKRIVTTSVLLSLAGACYGLWQTWVGFLPSEHQWIELGGYTALNVGVVRAFSFFSSASEYAAFVAIGIVFCWAAVLCGKYRYGALIPILGLALFLEGARGIVVFALFACVVMWALKGETRAAWALRGSLAIAVAGAGLFWTMQKVGGSEHDERIQSLIEHQVEGLTDPFAEDSSLHAHLSLTIGGIVKGVINPLGYGVGATTNAAGKYGGAQLGTERDFSNMFVSLGVVGGVLYALVIISVIKAAVDLWRMTRSWLALAMVGLLLVQLGSWLNGGQYSTAMLVWVCVGSLEYILNAWIRKMKETRKQTVANEVPRITHPVQ